MSRFICNYRPHLLRRKEVLHALHADIPYCTKQIWLLHTVFSGKGCLLRPLLFSEDNTFHTHYARKLLARLNCSFFFNG